LWAAFFLILFLSFTPQRQKKEKALRAFSFPLTALTHRACLPALLTAFANCLC
jgi:hypothetical protein